MSVVVSDIAEELVFEMFDFGEKFLDLEQEYRFSLLGPFELSFPIPGLLPSVGAFATPPLGVRRSLQMGLNKFHR
jgi:hypothetical protein